MTYRLRIQRFAAYSRLTNRPRSVPISEAPETVSIDRWLQALSLPVQPRRAPEGLFAWNNFTPPTQLTGNAAAARQAYAYWPRGLPASRQQAFFWSGFTPSAAAPFITVPQQWPDQFPGPKFSAAQQQAYASPLSERPETTSVDRWFQQLSQPYLVAKAVTHQQFLAEPVSESPETVSIDRWLQPLAQPYPAVRAVPYQMPWTGPVSTSPETVSEDRWHQPLSLPVLPRRAPEGVFAWSSYTPPPALATPTVPAQWPDVVRPIARAPWFQPHTAPLSERPETTTVDRWYAPFSLPVWSKPGLATWEQAAWWGPASEQPETTSPDRWWQQLSQPYPAKVFAQQQPYTAPISERPETVTVDRWWRDLSRHPGYRPAVITAQHPFGQIPWGAVLTTAITISQVQWRWVPSPLNANDETQMNISEATWHWNPFALTVTTPYQSNISEVTWHWTARAFPGFISNKAIKDTVWPNVLAVVRGVIKSVVVD